MIKRIKDWMAVRRIRRILKGKTTEDASRIIVAASVQLMINDFILEELRNMKDKR